MKLDRFWELLTGLPHRALHRYKRQFAAKLGQPSGRFRSNSIHEIMIDEIRKAAGESLFRGRGRWVLRADDDLIVQFKKIDASGRTSNIPTKAAQEWQTQLNLPGMPPAMRVTLGYRLDKMNTEVVDVCLVARDGDRIIWRESLDGQQDMFATPLRTATAKPAAKKLAAKKEAIEARGVKKKASDSED